MTAITLEMTNDETFAMPIVWGRHIPWKYRRILYYVYGTTQPEITVADVARAINCSNHSTEKQLLAVQGRGMLRLDGEKVLPTEGHETIQVPRWLIFADIPPELIEMLLYLRTRVDRIDDDGRTVYHLIKFGRKQSSILNNCRRLGRSTMDQMSFINDLLALGEKNGLFETVTTARGSIRGTVKLTDEYPSSLSSASWEQFPVRMFPAIRLVVLEPEEAVEEPSEGYFDYAFGQVFVDARF